MSWNVPTYRIRSYLRRMKSTRPRHADRGAPIHLKRVQAQVSVIEGLAISREMVPASALLNDLSLRGIFLFSTHAFVLGQRITITIQEPKTFFIRGRVVMCKIMSLHNNVISETSFPYRLGVLFEFRSAEERVAVKKYLDEIRGKFLSTSVCC